LVLHHQLVLHHSRLRHQVRYGVHYGVRHP
jgi:hypothetical protein